jgi:GNAT superfamily N-acetyltransferase
MLADDAVRIADAWWARDFACAPSDLRPLATRVQAHAGELAGTTGIWILVVGPCPLVSMPATRLPELAERASGWTASTVGDPTQLAEQVGTAPSQIIGPAFIGYATRDSLRSESALSARPLTERDAPTVARLRARCGVEEWEHGGSDFEKVPTFGSFDAQGELASIAGYETWNGTIAHISIVSSPAHRGQGHGVAPVARAAEHALAAGLLPQYRTLKSNQPSMRLARRLGFESYGFSTYVRLESVTGP